MDKKRYSVPMMVGIGSMCGHPRWSDIDGTNCNELIVFFAEKVGIIALNHKNVLYLQRKKQQ
ncbi:MAG: hypothetical protein IKI26_03010 [Prevotella sp.]|nr:hypothetical protein [Prevotella sp.]